MNLDHKEGSAWKNWCFWTVVLEKTLESPLDCKEIQPVHPKGNHPWIFTGRTDAEAEAPLLWQPDTKRWITGKDPDAFGKMHLDRLKAGGEGGGRGWDGYMASPTRWTWVWANSGRQWKTAVRGAAESQTQFSKWATTTTPGRKQGNMAQWYTQCPQILPYPAIESQCCLLCKT